MITVSHIARQTIMSSAGLDTRPPCANEQDRIRRNRRSVFVQTINDKVFEIEPTHMHTLLRFQLPLSSCFKWCFSSCNRLSNRARLALRSSRGSLEHSASGTLELLSLDAGRIRGRFTSYASQARIGF